jgi:hypothetical protein
MIYARSVGPLKKEVEKILGHSVETPQFHSISPY